MIIAILDALLGIYLRSLTLVDGILGSWVDLQAPDPVLPAGSTFAEQIARAAIIIADFMAQLAAQLDSIV